MQEIERRLYVLCVISKDSTRPQTSIKNGRRLQQFKQQLHPNKSSIEDQEQLPCLLIQPVRTETTKLRNAAEVCLQCCLRHLLQAGAGRTHESQQNGAISKHENSAAQRRSPNLCSWHQRSVCQQAAWTLEDLHSATEN